MKHFALAVLHSIGFTHKKLADIHPETAGEVYANINITSLIQRGFSLEQAQKIVDKNTDILRHNIESTLTNLKIQIVHRDDGGFPVLLRNIPNAPTILYVRGVLHPNDGLISVVGSRKHSQYSESSLNQIIPGLIRSGYGIVSGGAYGIDSVAHAITLREKGHTTVVFGSGVDVYYPTSNTALFDQIIANSGAIISHFPLGTQPEPYNFPIRNELVASMSRGTLIAEAGEDSGTLITARLALEANRDVYVIPADITRDSALGSNRLIRDGLGKLITCVEDILIEYQIANHQLSFLQQERPKFDTPTETAIYGLLCLDSLTIDQIGEKLSSDTQTVTHALTMMELSGHIRSSGGVFSVL